MKVDVDTKKIGLGLLSAVADLSRWYLRAAVVAFGVITALQISGVIVLY